MSNNKYFLRYAPTTTLLQLKENFNFLRDFSCMLYCGGVKGNLLFAKDKVNKR